MLSCTSGNFELSTILPWRSCCTPAFWLRGFSIVAPSVCFSALAYQNIRRVFATALLSHSCPLKQLQAALPCCPHTVGAWMRPVLPCRRSSSGAELCASTVGAASVKVFPRGFDRYLTSVGRVQKVFVSRERWLAAFCVTVDYH